MKGHLKTVLAFSVAALVASAVSIFAATAAPAEGSARVYVGFKPGSKAAAQQLINAGRGNVHYEFDDLNAIAASLPAQAVAALQNNPNIEYVEDDPPRYLLSTQTLTSEYTPYGITMVQAPQVWPNYQGAGVKIGVIDSGVLATHEDFAGVSLGGYNNPSLQWSQDGYGHGTHVVGTIAAAMSNTKGVVGVSPKASIYMFRVFGDSGAWTYSSSLLSAAQNCKNAGCKIISMSLGGGRSSRTEQQGMDSLYNNGNGVLLIAAAGNDGTSGTSYPAGYASVVSVGAIDGNKQRASFSQFNSDVELCAPGVGVLSTVPYTEEIKVIFSAGTFDASPIEFAAYGEATGPLVDGGQGTAVTSAWSGKVVLIERGGNSFYDKVSNAQRSGALAAIIYNDESGNFNGTLSDGNSSTIPAVSISQENGNTLKASQLSQSVTVKNLHTANVSGYDFYDGTSMATPHVSGVAALVWSKNLGLKAGDIRSLLQSTAEDLGSAGRDTSFGYGLVRALNAVAAAPGGAGGGGDTTAPVISNVRSAIVNAKQATFKITWDTNEPATSTVTFANGGGSTDNTLATSHSVSFRGTKGATYTYNVSSTDAAGNASSSGPYIHQN